MPMRPDRELRGNGGLRGAATWTVTSALEQLPPAEPVVTPVSPSASRDEVPAAAQQRWLG